MSILCNFNSPAQFSVFNSFSLYLFAVSLTNYLHINFSIKATQESMIVLKKQLKEVETPMHNYI
ncbi:MAG: hypothetical protein QM528_05255 [Phycisphaerales bacterium]|nr:hypothetical protein [Phycisphaerales bacterium]